MAKSFGSQIRGGESSFRLRVSTEEAMNLGGTLDIAVALNWEDFLRFGSELPVDGTSTVIYDAKTGIAPDKVPLAVQPAEALPVPIEAMAKEHAGTDKAKNTIVLGLMAGWCGLAHESIVSGLRKRFAKKGPELVAANERAFEAGIAVRAGAPAAPVAGHGAAGQEGRQAAHRRQRDRAAPRPSSRASSSSRATRSPPRPRSCSS